jgi:cysteine-rich repeat protein
MMRNRWARVCGIAIMAVAAVRSSAQGLFCPAGEITLGPGSLHVSRAGNGSGKVSSSGATFSLPTGVSIDPAHEPVVFAIEANRQPIGQTTLAASAVAVKGGGTRFLYHDGKSRVVLKKIRKAYKLSARFGNFDLTGFDPNNPPQFIKQTLQVGNDCFSSVLKCDQRNGKVLCTPERNALLAGSVAHGPHAPLPGAMVTLINDSQLETVSVFVQQDGRYVFPRVRPGNYTLRVRLIGYEDVVQQNVTLGKNKKTRVDVTMSPTSNTNDQVPASEWFSLILDKWPDPKIRADFTLSCGNCHQIGAYRFRRSKTEDQWRAVLTQMMLNLPPYFQETRDTLIQNVIDTYGPNATIPQLPVPPPPSGETLKAVLYEYVIGTPGNSPGCHDLELGADNRLYSDSGLRWIDPRTGERGTYPFTGGSHSIERGPDGNMWITQAGSDSLAEVYVDGVTPPRYFHLPKLNGVQGAYPHTNRFDAQGQLWMTLTKSNQLALFKPDTAQWTYYPLPEADAAETGLSIPVAYGCDVAPDQSPWWSQLFGERIGHYDPTTDTMKAWRPPFYGPRRLGVGKDGIVWVPGYGSGVLGRFDPAIERWKVYPLPTGLTGPPGFGTTEMPYNLSANRNDGFVWINGTNSDSMIRFDPETEHFTVYPMPTGASYTREIEFDADNNVWTCTSNEPSGPTDPGTGKFVKVELPPPDAECGNGRLESTEECDDGNTTDCDGCSAHCRIETGCGDGAVCDGEQCDDGNTADCDGCSSTCVVETGLLCGDGILNGPCGEECDPPVPGQCDTECKLIPYCGDGNVDPGEECDDGALNGTPNHCTSSCKLPGCGDGVVDQGEECDDGNETSCDGCSADCEIEVGWQCGDGITNAACGEECDPPGPGSPDDCNYLCKLGPAAALGTRTFTFGGALYSSPLGNNTPLGTPIGSVDLVAGAPTYDGSAGVTVSGPTYFEVPILGGAFGYFCGRLTSCTGTVYCNGGMPSGVLVEQDSAGQGKQNNPVVTTTGLGPDGGPGTVVLTCNMSTLQVNPPEPDCSTKTYPADQPTAFTTGPITARFLNAYAQIGTGQISGQGANFVCSQWSTPGTGALAGAFLIEQAPQAGDTANLLRISE